jgi:sugar phosphate isomerase/epimerase
VLPFGIQLYSVRDHLARDIPATLRGLKAAGYDHVELFGVGPADAEAWKPMLADAELRAVAAHLDFETVTGDPDGVMRLARTLGFEDIIVPWLKLDGAKEWVKAATTLDAVGKCLREAGFRLGYHNHEHEFEPIGETTPFDILFDYTKPDNMFLELDVRWAEHNGGDARAIIREFGQRCRFLHLKERPKSGTGFTEVGRGVIDWQGIVAIAKKARVQWYIVEQDESDTDSIESARISAEYVKTL